MGDFLLSISDVFASSTANATSAFTFLGLPVVAYAIAIVLVVAGIWFVRKQLSKLITKVLGGRRGGRRRR